jgi:hypothetical protein
MCQIKIAKAAQTHCTREFDRMDEVRATRVGLVEGAGITKQSSKQKTSESSMNSEAFIALPSLRKLIF